MMHVHPNVARDATEMLDAVPMQLRRIAAFTFIVSAYDNPETHPCLFGDAHLAAAVRNARSMGQEVVE